MFIFYLSLLQYLHDSTNSHYYFSSLNEHLHFYFCRQRILFLANIIFDRNPRDISSRALFRDRCRIISTEGKDSQVRFSRFFEPITFHRFHLLPLPILLNFLHFVSLIHTFYFQGSAGREAIPTVGFDPRMNHSR